MIRKALLKKLLEARTVLATAISAASPLRLKIAAEMDALAQGHSPAGPVIQTAADVMRGPAKDSMALLKGWHAIATFEQHGGKVSLSSPLVRMMQGLSESLTSGIHASSETGIPEEPLSVNELMDVGQTIEVPGTQPDLEPEMMEAPGSGLEDLPSPDHVEADGDEGPELAEEMEEAPEQMDEIMDLPSPDASIATDGTVPQEILQYTLGIKPKSAQPDSDFAPQHPRATKPSDLPKVTVKAGRDQLTTGTGQRKITAMDTQVTDIQHAPVTDQGASKVIQVQHGVVDSKNRPITGQAAIFEVQPNKGWGEQNVGKFAVVLRQFRGGAPFGASTAKATFFPTQEAAILAARKKLMEQRKNAEKVNKLGS